MGSRLAHPTRYRHRHIRDSRLIYASGIGEVDMAIHSKDYEALLREQPFEDNAVTDEGETWTLDVAFRDNQTSGLTSFGYGVSTASGLSETSTEATMTEMADAGGYANKTVARSTGGWDAPTGTTPTTMDMTTTASWTATADWGLTIYWGILFTIGLTTDRLIAITQIGSGSGRDILDGDTLNSDLQLQAGGA